MQRKLFLASAACHSGHFHYSGVTDRTMEAHTEKQSDFQERRMPENAVRCAMAKTDGGFETWSGPSLQ
jgi:hypothetical protein